MALVHASPESLWRAPAPEATDAELESVYGPLGQPIAVYAHIHRPYIRSVSSPWGERLVINTGSVSLSYDGDRRASYLLLDGPSDPARGVRRRQGGESSVLVWPTSRGLDREDPPRRLSADALAIRSASRLICILSPQTTPTRRAQLFSVPLASRRLFLQFRKCLLKKRGKLNCVLTDAIHRLSEDHKKELTRTHAGLIERNVANELYALIHRCIREIP
jgi:hypothetical protein